MSEWLQALAALFVFFAVSDLSTGLRRIAEALESMDRREHVKHVREGDKAP